MADPLPRRIVWFAPWTWKRRTKVAAILLLVFMGYPLSVGPTMVLVINQQIPYEVYWHLYYPLHIVTTQSDVLWDAQNRYEHWWLSLTD